MAIAKFMSILRKMKKGREVLSSNVREFGPRDYICTEGSN